MKEDTRIVAKIKAQISKFLRLISKDFSKAKRKLVKLPAYKAGHQK